MKDKIKRIIKYKHFPIITASLALVLLFTLSFSYGSRLFKRRGLTTTPLLWAKLDGALTDENSAGSVFAYSPGKPSTEMGISIKEGDNIQYSPGSTIDAGSSVYENWNPNQGTMNVWVQPNWNGSDNIRHDIWNGDLGRIDTSDSNLKAYFKLDEGSEDYAFDSTANGNVGRLHGSALSFDGGDYVKVGDPISGVLDFGISTDFSIEAWVKRNGDFVGYIFGKVSGTSDKCYGAYINNGSITAFLNDGSGGSTMASSAVAMTNGIWYHIAAVFDRDGNLQVYTNGATNGSAVSISGEGDISNSYNFAIGRKGSANESYFNGQINNVRIHSRALSATEVAQHYAGDFSGGNSGLVGFWPMDENQGQAVADMSGSGNDGTLGVDSGSSTDDPTWVNYAPAWTEEGRFGKGIIFDGTDDEMEIGDIDF